MRWTVKRENKKQCSLFNIRRGKRVKDLILLVLNSQVSVHSSCSLASCRTAATIKIRPIMKNIIQFTQSLKQPSA
jgi:hypothetical protein